MRNKFIIKYLKGKCEKYYLFATKEVNSLFFWRDFYFYF